jgi:hypothetical protein
VKFAEDPRIKISRKILALAWLFFSLYLAERFIPDVPMTDDEGDGEETE